MPKRSEAGIDAPPEFRKEVVRAIQAITLYASNSGGSMVQHPPPSPLDCKIALDWIINEASRYYDVPHFVDDINGRRDAFVNGRRFVGKQIVMAMQIKPDVVGK